MAGDYVTLIDAVSITGTPTLVDSQVTQGISLIYDVDVAQNGNQITATIVDKRVIDPGTGTDPSTGTGGELPATVNPQLKSLSEGYLSGLAFANSGADIALSAFADLETIEGLYTPFMLIEGDSIRYNSGSHVDLIGVHTLIGTSYQGDGYRVAGFIEGGYGDYDSYNSFSTAASVHGKGDTQYYGVGVIGEHNINEQFYVDGSLRAGQVQTDYKTHDIADAQGRNAKYDTSAAYIGAHAGAGYILPIDERNQLDFSGKYLWTHVGSDHVEIVGDPIRFKAIDSHRVRLMAKLEHQYSPGTQFTVGLGYEHEFDAKAKATTYQKYDIKAPSLKGETGILELGVKTKLTGNLSLNLKANGYVGKREGGSGRAQLMYEF